MHINVRGTRKIISNVSSFTPRYEFQSTVCLSLISRDTKSKLLKHLKKLLPQMNMIIELRDIRAPLSTRNVVFDRIARKEHDVMKLVVYTRKDLMPGNKPYIGKLKNWHEELGEKFIYWIAETKLTSGIY
ncbi:CGH_1_HP_G0101290.mRNA.1.CDS.1 [Saccharomyces cerevisiae]|nr:CGH_1_HP_G0101290.mRNA.1.CDS.1 [Saccharomyces cerevisiae]CAI6948247.1 CGH_1_HP_G0101290.mRNA.1.CDS.1 [Saccharomyces cerevisiae]